MSQPQQVNVDLSGGGGTEVPGETASAALAADPRSTTALTSRTAASGLGDRLNHVFREIRPLVEHARMGNNSRLSLPTWLRTPPHPAAYYGSEGGLAPAPRPLATVAHVNLGPNSQTYVLSERLTPSIQRQPSEPVGGAVPESNVDESPNAPDNHGEINISINPSNNNNIPDEENESTSEDGAQQVLDVRAFLSVLIKYAPFYLILLVKFMYDRREGLFTFMILLCTFLHSNSLVRRECGKQSNRSVVALFFELVYTVGCVAIVHLLFGHERLLPNVVMFPGYKQPIDVWELLWIVCLTDLVVKIITVDLKVIITATPAVILPFQKRGKVYLFIEAISQLYRSLLPIKPWLFYLMHSYQGPEMMIGMFLSTVYVVSKVIELIVRLKLLINATWTLLQSVNLGTKLTAQQLLSAGESCPICHDDYSTPVRLGCGHIFCELCIAAWLDREHTCPLCRAKVADEPTWRDGSTTHYFQLY